MGAKHVVDTSYATARTQPFVDMGHACSCSHLTPDEAASSRAPGRGDGAKLPGKSPESTRGNMSCLGYEGGQHAHTNTSGGRGAGPNI